ncbi:hypothetical protein Tco_0688906, partial [Tanacetum coccineum]
EPGEELEVDAEEDVLPVATPPVGSPITPLSVLESSSDSEAATPVTANGTHWMPPPGSTFEVGGPSSVSLFPLFYLHVRELERLNNNTKMLLSNVNYLERCEKKRQAEVDVNSSEVTGLEKNDREKKDKMEKMEKRLESLETNYALVLSDKDRLERAFYHMQVWVSERLGWGAMDARPDDSINVLNNFGESQPPKP